MLGDILFGQGKMVGGKKKISVVGHEFHWGEQHKESKNNGSGPLRSGDKPGTLGDIAEQQANPQSKQPRGPQGPGRHLADPGQPPLHGLGEEDIGNRFQNNEQAKHGDKKFHGRTLPAAWLFFKINKYDDRPPAKRWMQEKKQTCILSHHDNP
jgi:hypothetical protein